MLRTMSVDGLTAAVAVCLILLVVYIILCQLSRTRTESSHQDSLHSTKEYASERERVIDL